MSFKEWMNEADEPISEPGAGVDIFFNNLDEVTQKKVMEGLYKELNISEDDDFANKKIVDGLSKTPIINIISKDIVNKIKFDI